MSSGGTRIGDADRERLAAALGRHYVEGRLDTEELGRRLDAVHAAATREDAAAALTGLPPLGDPVPSRRRRRRHAEAAAPEPGWVPTRERFVDPTTARVMRVWVDPAAGARHYVADGS